MSTDPPSSQRPAEVVDAERVPSARCGDYVLVQQLGLGGYGIVYRAWQRSLSRWVALKFLHLGGSVELERFKREARMAAKLSHPGIVPVYEVGEHEGRAFLTMQLVDGESLDRARLEPREALEVVIAAAEAVHHAHVHGVVHRDLKPANLMRARDGRVYVMDFGLARGMSGEEKVTRTGIVAGTPAYMSPEQAMGQECDARSDVYSLGATLYELLTRHAPFEGTTPVVVLASVMNVDPVPAQQRNPWVSRALDAVVAKAMDKLPARRYATAQAFADDLRRALRGEPVVARPASTARKAWAWVRRHPLATTVAAAFALGLVGASAGALFHASTVSRARAAAEAERRAAEGRLASALIAQGDALATAGRWGDAMARYRESARVLERLGASPVIANLAIMAALEASPPPLQVYEGHAGLVTNVALAERAGIAASSSEDGTARIWELATGRSRHVLRGHAGAVWSVALSPDGSVVATGGDDRVVRLWDAATGTLVRKLEGFGGKIGALAFTRDGRGLLTGSEDNLLRLWDVGSGALVRSFAGHAGRVRGIDVSHAGTRVVTAGGDLQAIVWSLADGKVVSRLPAVRQLFAARFSVDDAQVLIGGEDGITVLYDVRTGARLGWNDRLGGVVSGLALSPRGDVAVTASWDGRTTLLSLPSLTFNRALDAGQTRVMDVRISSDGRRLLNAVGSQLQLFELEELHGPQHAMPSVFSVTPAFSADGGVAVTWTEDRTQLLVWDVPSHRVAKRLPLRDRVARVAFARDGRSIAVVADEPYAVTSWPLDRDEPAWRCEVDAQPFDVDFAGDGEVWVGTRDGLRVFGRDGCPHGRPIAALPEAKMIVRITSSPSGAYLASVGGDAVPRLWDVSARRLARALDPLDGIGLSAAFSPAGDRLVAGSGRGQIHVYAVPSGERLYRITGAQSPVFSVNVSRDARWLASGGGDRTVRLYELASGRETRSFPPHLGRIAAMRFTEDGKLQIGHGEGDWSTADFDAAARETEIHGAWEEARARLARGDESPPVWETMGNWFMHRHAFAEAAQMYDRELRSGGHPPALPHARALWAAERFAEAAPLLRAAVERGELSHTAASLMLSAR